MSNPTDFETSHLPSFKAAVRMSSDVPFMLTKEGP